MRLELNANVPDLIVPITFCFKLETKSHYKGITLQTCSGPIDCKILNWSAVGFTLLMQTFGAEFERSC